MHQRNLTAAEIKALSDDDARAMLAEIATKLCGSDRWVTDLAGMLGVDRRTVQAWKGGEVRPTDLALVAMQALERADRLQGFADQVAFTIRAATQLGEL